MKMKQLKFWSIALIAMLFITSCDVEKEKEKENKLEASFVFTPLNPKINEVVKFTSTSKNASYYEWDFGDGNTSSYENPEHTYTSEGTFEVQLTVSNKAEESLSVSKTIEVSAALPGTVIEHNSDITADEVWGSQYIHIVTRNIEVKDATLTIEPGAVVKFNDDAGLEFGYSNNISHSKLIAQGTADKHITFTANKVNPQSASWEWIYFGSNASPECVMEYCDISYGGTYSSTSGSVIVKGTNIIFNHNTVSYSESKGIACWDDGHFSSFTHNTITDNKGSAMGIQAKYAHTLGENNNIANTKNGINISGDIDIPGDFLWHNHGAKYTFISDVNVGSENGTSLTIEKGVTIAFKEDKDFTIGYYDNKSGKLTAVGTESEPIRFVSAKANSSAGDWEFIWFGEFNDPTSKMEYCEIDAGGGYSDSYGSVHLRNTEISFDNCKITNSSAYGISLDENAFFTSFKHNTISNSAQSSVRIPAQWTHTIGFSNDLANDKFGIEVFGDFNHQNKNLIWIKQTCPYTLVSDVQIGSIQGCSLTIDPGTTIKLAQDVEFSVAYSDNLSGALIARGTAGNKITFTSATPTGAWEFIWFGQGTMQESILEHCNIINGGSYSSSYGAIHCDNITFNDVPTIKNCLISNSVNHGISIDEANPLMENNTFENNNGEDVHYQ